MTNPMTTCPGWLQVCNEQQEFFAAGQASVAAHPNRYAHCTARQEAQIEVCGLGQVLGCAPQSCCLLATRGWKQIEICGPGQALLGWAPQPF